MDQILQTTHFTLLEFTEFGEVSKHVIPQIQWFMMTCVSHACISEAVRAQFFFLSTFCSAVMLDLQWLQVVHSFDHTVHTTRSARCPLQCQKPLKERTYGTIGIRSKSLKDVHELCEVDLHLFPTGLVSKGHIVSADLVTDVQLRFDVLERWEPAVV